ncbi:MAG: hypothetical protein EYC70_12300 [Planctomycetota bacterium]|nr:MAG: hypothetical protein EYC70_12300 [Planctomycetota bacterium]
MHGVMSRRIDDAALSGAENMARDEALLELRLMPTLRFYRWARPTLSLGYFQRHTDLPVDAVLARGGEVVRRATGGKAILHEHELTYSLCAPETGALAGGPARAMSALHQALASALSAQLRAPVSVRGGQVLASDRAGSSWCFLDSSPLDLALRGRKLLGSAARRRGGWILFHGSLVLAPPRETPDVAALGFEPDREDLAAALGAALGLRFRPGDWTAEELNAARRIAAARYAAEAFTRRL